MCKKAILCEHNLEGTHTHTHAGHTNTVASRAVKISD